MNVFPNIVPGYGWPRSLRPGSPKTVPVQHGIFDVSKLKGHDSLYLEGEWLAVSGPVCSTADAGAAARIGSIAVFENVGFRNLFDVEDNDPL